MIQTTLFLCLMSISLANADCEADVEAYFQGLDPNDPINLQPWSLEMFDSSAKFITDGVYELAFIYQFANFDQCLAVNGPDGVDGKPRFTGQYCFFDAGLRLPLNSNVRRAYQTRQIWPMINNDVFRTEEVTTDANGDVIIPTFWGVCAPSSCGLDGVKRVADFNLQFFASAFGSKANTTVWYGSCYHNNDGSSVLDPAAWGFIAFVSFLLLLVLVSTVMDNFFPKFGWIKLFKPFSLNQTLVQDLTRLPKGSNPGTLGCLHGMRTVSMLWIILCHTYSVALSFPVQNYVSVSRQFSQQWFMAPILNGFVSVDTFFLLSGLLTVYVPMKELSKGRKFNVLKYYIYRYLRITIPLAIAIWFMSTVFIYTGNGPIWIFGFPNVIRICQEHWWANLLYITNYFYEYCMSHTWYLCVDMQLALLAPLIIYPLMKWPKYGLVAICILTLGSIAAVFAVTYVEDLPWTSQSNVPGAVGQRYIEIIYTNTPMRASPYLIGMALGYFLHKKSTFSLPKWVVALGWLASAALALGVIFLILVPYSESYVPTPLKAAFYSSLHRPAWALSLSWIIWACVNGHGGVVDRMLSWKYFVPLSKLTFCAYLTHMPVMSFFVGLRRTSYFFSHLENWYLFGGFLFTTLPFTVFLYLAVEAPSMNLLRLAFKKDKARVAVDGKSK